MPRYRLTGAYDIAPDRGDPDGYQQPVSHSFEAEDDEAARTYTASWIKRPFHQEVIEPKLVRIEQEEQIQELAL